METMRTENRKPNDPAEESARWRAVLARDRSQDGRFVYGVRSTLVYCRPSCPSRRPRRESVAFFPDAKAAARAGYRACLRCGPRAAESPEAALVARACALLERSGDGAGVDAAAKALGVSPERLRRAFGRTLGVAPKRYLEARRIARAKTSLRTGRRATDAPYEAGYGSASRLYEKANARLGMTPATYGRGGRGARIAYGVFASPLGRMLVAATERGLCAVYLGHSAAALARELRAEYPEAALVESKAAVKTYAEAIARDLAGRAPPPDLPLDVRVTAFQARVWDALRRIPRGQTRSYVEIAASLGAPKASRAVGRACATNPVSLAIPCHRAVGADGGVTGYRWGKARKRKLLEIEKG